MVELVQDNWILLAIALVVAVLVAWWLFAATRRTKVEIERREEAEGAPAKRNQALIDAPPAASATSTIPPPTPIGMAGIGTALEAATSIAPPPPEPVAEVAAPAVAPAVSDAASAAIEEAALAPAGDELLRIKGLGSRIVEQLHALGITSLVQIAAWDEAEIDRIDAQLGRFQGRIRRDNWTEQARLLTSGDVTAYEARFGKL